MKITDINTRPVGNYALVEVFTDEGIKGIGAVDSHYPMVKSIIDPDEEPGLLTRLLIGEDPREVERLWAKMEQSTFWHGRGGGVTHAMSGIDIALWDILGKSTGLPVVALLGGYRRHSVKPYASITANSIDALKEKAQRAIKLGFKAIKIGWGALGVDFEQTVKWIKTTREIVGSDVDLMVDFGCSGSGRAISVSAAKKVIKAIEKYNLSWIEEPLPPDDINGYAELRQFVDVPISGGEVFVRVQEFKLLCEKHAVDIVQPDVCKAGGLTELKRIALLAQLENMLCVPHAWSTAVCIAASIHLVASIPNGKYVEFQIENPLNTELLAEPFEIKDGYIEVPVKPGLGIELLD
jgi:L-alanine-DL-glutamate epimerase-like enolase superfamily enzyme